MLFLALQEIRFSCMDEHFVLENLPVFRG